MIENNSTKLTKDERETTLNYCESDDCWYIDTSIGTHIRKCDKLGYECTGVQYYNDGTIMAKQYKVPKFAISFRKPEKIKREITDEQRKAISDRMRMYHSSKHADL